MGIGIQLAGGVVVHRVIERYFSRTTDAQSYLQEWGVPAEELEGKHFQHRGYKFMMSHPIEQVMSTTDDLPDNDLSSAYRDNLRSFVRPSRGTKGDESRKHDVTDGKPSAPFRSKPAKSVNTGKTVNLKQVCAELKLDPSKARQKLRKKYGAKGLRYEWSPEEAEEIRKVLAP